MTSQTSYYLMTMTTMRHCSILEFGRGHTIKQSARSSPDFCTPLCSIYIVCWLARRFSHSFSLNTLDIGRALMILVSAGVNGRWFSYGCRKLPMDQYANCGTIVWLFIEIFIWQPCTLHARKLQHPSHSSLTWAHVGIESVLRCKVFVLLNWRSN